MHMTRPCRYASCAHHLQHVLFNLAALRIEPPRPVPHAADCGKAASREPTDPGLPVADVGA